MNYNKIDGLLMHLVNKISSFISLLTHTFRNKLHTVPASGIEVVVGVIVTASVDAL